jgi:ABC-type multidrug transport system ATPase subunit
MHCVETTDLFHQYSSDETVLNGINLQVPTGSIYGFLGPNGAGKTTTLRLILGLLKKQRGSISIFGKKFDQHRIEILGKVGSLIESPSLYDHLTATENLALLQKIYRCPQSQIPHVLGLVGLAHTGSKKAGRFSLGMKQRLSLAIALLHRPALLILDEPTNGLDPNGIIEMRDLLHGLNREKGITIVISSHLLSEVEKLVTHLGIIARGRLVFQGELDELRSKQQQVLSVSLRVPDVTRALQIMAANGHPASAQGGRVVLPAISSEAIAAINRLLVNRGVDVSEIEVVKNDLERIFMKLIEPLTDESSLR